MGDLFRMKTGNNEKKYVTIVLSYYVRHDPGDDIISHRQGTPIIKEIEGKAS